MVCICLGFRESLTSCSEAR